MELRFPCFTTPPIGAPGSALDDNREVGSSRKGWLCRYCRKPQQREEAHAGKLPVRELHRGGTAARSSGIM